MKLRLTSLLGSAITDIAAKYTWQTLSEVIYEITDIPQILDYILNASFSNYDLLFLTLPHHYGSVATYHKRKLYCFYTDVYSWNVLWQIMVRLSVSYRRFE